MAHKDRFVTHLGFAIILSTQVESAIAQERPVQQNEPRANEVPQRPEDGKPRDDDSKPKRKDREAPAPPAQKNPPEDKPAPKSQQAPQEQKNPAEKVPAPAPEVREPTGKDKSKSAPAPVDVKPAPAPMKEQPTVVPPKPVPVPLPAPAPDTEKKSVPLKPQLEPTKPGGDPSRGAIPLSPGEKSSAPAPKAPTNLPAATTAPVQPAAPVDVRPAPATAPSPVPAPNSGTKSGPIKPLIEPSKPGAGALRGTNPALPGEKTSSPLEQPQVVAPAPETTPAQPAVPSQQSAPQKPPVIIAPAAVLPAAPPNAAAPTAFQPGFQPVGVAPQRLQDIQKSRTERVEDGGKLTVIQEIDNRVIIQQDNRTIIRHDETQRFAKNATDVKSERLSDGTTQTIIVQPGGIQIYNIVDNSGRTIRRYRRDERGRDFDIIDNRSFYRNEAVLGVGLVVGAVVLALRPPEVLIPREKYIVDYDRASDDDIYETLTAPPVERLARRYSLEEVRYSHELREHMRRLDLDTVTFEFSSWEVTSAQFTKLERVARIMDRILQKRPDEVFLVEGHTDAVGSNVDNLTLSDRRAQAVAEILTGVFKVPAENLVTQGYGKQYLKISTQEPERANRRVAIRRITPLMSEDR